MKKSGILSRIILALAIVAAAAYIGLNIYSAASKPFDTEFAVTGTVAESAPVQGWIVRNETVLTDGAAVVSLSVKDGVKVANGQTVAVGYSGEEAIKNAGEILTLRNRISQLESFELNTDDNGDDSASAAAARLSSAAARGDLSNLTDISMAVRGAVFGEKSEGQEELLSLKTELARLESESDGIDPILAPVSGTFTSATDGYESVSGPDLEGLTVSGLRKLFSGDEKQKEGVVGKIAEGSVWYFAATAPESAFEELKPGDGADIAFYGSYSGTLKMTLEQVSAPSDGKCAAVFSCRTAMADTISIRELTGEILFGSSTGIRVPKAAIYSDEDGTYLYIVSGLQARKVYADIVCEDGDCYLVSGELRPGVEIITKAFDLYDGKVVR